MPAPVSAGKRYLLHAGSVLRIVGVILGGVTLIWLGTWVSTILTSISPTNPTATFQTLGNIIILAGVSVIFTGIGWSMQTWARGM